MAGQTAQLYTNQYKQFSGWQPLGTSFTFKKTESLSLFLHLHKCEFTMLGFFPDLPNTYVDEFQLYVMFLQLLF
jgi:hypothetical protein